MPTVPGSKNQSRVAPIQRPDDVDYMMALSVMQKLGSIAEPASMAPAGVPGVFPRNTQTAPEAAQSAREIASGRVASAVKRSLKPNKPSELEKNPDEYGFQTHKPLQDIINNMLDPEQSDDAILDSIDARSRHDKNDETMRGMWLLQKRLDAIGHRLGRPESEDFAPPAPRGILRERQV